MPNPKCSFKKPDGQQCGGHAVNGSQYCFSHDPASSEAKLDAVKKGGASRQRHLEPFEIKSVHDLPSLLADTMNQVRTGNMTEKTGNTIARLSDAFLRANGLP